MNDRHIRFHNLLIEYSQEKTAGKRQAIENTVWSEFGREMAVLTLDMSGFSLLSQKYGIIHYLSLIRRMRLSTQPLIEQYRGTVIKYVADNCYAVFPDSSNAVKACIVINRAFNESKLTMPREPDIRVSCGIDYGKILLIEHADFFGNPVNCSSKLGEDCAKPGEILITRNAVRSNDVDSECHLEPVRFCVSGIDIEAFSVVYQ